MKYYSCFEVSNNGINMPDYDNGVYLGSISSFIAPADGYLWWSFNTNTGYSHFFVYINNHSIPSGSRLSFLDGDVHHCDFLMISKGDKLEFIDAINVEFTFYPCK